MRRSWLAAALVAALAACGSPAKKPVTPGDVDDADDPTGPEPIEPEEILWMDVYAAYPGARELCRHTAPVTDGEIGMIAYATPDPEEQVVAFYGEPDLTYEQEGEDLVVALSVKPASEGDPGCGVTPAPEDASVIIVSRGPAAPDDQ